MDDPLSALSFPQADVDFTVSVLHEFVILTSWVGHTNKRDCFIIISDFTIRPKNKGNLRVFCVKILNMDIVTLRISDFDGHPLFPRSAFSDPVVI